MGEIENKKPIQNPKTIHETTIPLMLEAIAEDMCDNYCKKPEEWRKEHNQTLEQYKDDDNFEEFMEAVCDYCPLNILR